MTENSEPKIYVMSRGGPAIVAEELLKMWDDVITAKIRDHDLPDVFKKIKEIKWNYSGSFYSFT